MAKIFRFSGYCVQTGKIDNIDNFSAKFDKLKNYERDTLQQLHIEESEEILCTGEELKDNCDLALLLSHFKKETSMEYDRPIPKVGEKYRHFKLGKIVTVIGISRHTETEEVSVVYEYEGTIWNRPFDMFMSKVDKEKYPDATQEYRFEKMKER